MNKEQEAQESASWRNEDARGTEAGLIKKYLFQKMIEKLNDNYGKGKR
jgi:hypothetical protein